MGKIVTRSTASSGAITLADLTDVTISGAVNGEVLEYNAGTWENSTAAGSGDMLKATYDPANIAEQLLGLNATQITNNKTIAGGNF